MAELKYLCIGVILMTLIHFNICEIIGASAIENNDEIRDEQVNSTGGVHFSDEEALVYSESSAERRNDNYPQAIADNVKSDSVSNEGDSASSSTLNAPPLFAPFKHAKIDTAELSDCARQGEWQPIGVPPGHYADHSDHQKEYFHHAAEHVPHSSAQIQHAQSPPPELEGVAIWHQLGLKSGAPSFAQPHHLHTLHHHKPKAPFAALSDSHSLPQKAGLDVTIPIQLPAAHTSSKHVLDFNSDGLLSPPPLPPPHKFKVHHPKHTKPVKSFWGKPYSPYNRPPPPVVEHHHNNENPDSSTFTCGHNHDHGANYHTASYQVEGEADPSLLADDNQQYPVILGEPHSEADELFHQHIDSAFKRTNAPEDQDQVKEGSQNAEIDSADEDKVVEDLKMLARFGDKMSKQIDANESSADRLEHRTQPTSSFDTHFENLQSTFDHSGVATVNFGSFPSFGESNKDRPLLGQNNHLPKSDFNNFFEKSSFNEQPFAKTPFLSSEFEKQYNSPNYKESIAVFDHPPPARNRTKTHLPPKRKRPHKQYEVMENSGENIPLSAYFPPSKGPKQFNNRTPNIAIPKPKRPKSDKYQSQIYFDKDNVDVYQKYPSKVSKVKVKGMRGRIGVRPFESDIRRSVTLRAKY